MSDIDTSDLLAARAAGEEFPGTDPAELDDRLAASADAREELAGYRALCSTVRSAIGDAPAVRPIRRPRRRARRIAIAVAAAAALLVVARVALRTATPPVMSPIDAPNDAAPDPFAGFAPTGAPPAIGPDALRPNGEPRMGGPPDGAASDAPEAGPVRGFAGQVGFAVLLPARLPEGFGFAEARLLPGWRTDVVRVVYRGTGGGLIVLLQAAPGAERASPLGSAVPPAGWAAVREEAGGTVALLASPSLTEEALRGVLRAR